MALPKYRTKYHQRDDDGYERQRKHERPHGSLARKLARQAAAIEHGEDMSDLLAIPPQRSRHQHGRQTS